MPWACDTAAMRSGSGSATPDGPYLPLGGGQDAVFQASGMISVQLGVGVDEALVRLRAYAFSHDRPLHDVANAVVVRRFRFNAPGPAAGM